MTTTLCILNSDTKSLSLTQLIFRLHVCFTTNHDYILWYILGLTYYVRWFAYVCYHSHFFLNIPSSIV